MFGFRLTALRTPLATAALLGAAAAATTAPAAARAQAPITVNFNGLVDTAAAGVRYVGNCYTESGLTFTAVGAGCGASGAYAFAVAFPANPPAYIGSPALYLNDPVATQIAITRANGGLFSMQSIVLAPFIGQGGTVGFTGFLANGTSVFQSFSVPDGPLYSFQPSQLYTFSSAFVGLTSLRMDPVQMPSGDPYINFDDVTYVAAASTVPEPMTVVLLGGGLLGLGMVARTRGSRRRAASDLRA